MGATSKYWNFTYLESSGQVNQREIKAAKAFFQQKFPEFAGAIEVPDELIQQHLFQWLKVYVEDSSAFPETSQLAACCLRCFISNQIPSICASFIRKFNLQKHLSKSEALSYVLDDVNPWQIFSDRHSYIPFAIRVLQTYQPNQGSLIAWIRRLIYQHSELNRTLRQHGIYIATDWAILNNVTVTQVQRLLSDRFTASEIQHTCKILDSFHQVYRADRLQQRTLIIGKSCNDPTQHQLQRMLQILDAPEMPPLTPSQLLRELRLLAYQLRSARRPPILSLDERSVALLVQPQSHWPSEEEEFLHQYRLTSEEALYQAVKQVLDEQIRLLRNRQPAKAQDFQKALALFFLHQKSMTEIAQLVGLKQQFQVSRLLQIKSLRVAIEQAWVSLMRQQLRSLVLDYVRTERQEAAQLHQLFTKLDEILLETIDRIMTENISECYSAKRTTSSMLSRCICQYLATFSLSQRDQDALAKVL